MVGGRFVVTSDSDGRRPNRIIADNSQFYETRYSRLDQSVLSVFDQKLCRKTADCGSRNLIDSTTDLKKKKGNNQYRHDFLPTNFRRLQNHRYCDAREHGSQFASAHLRLKGSEGNRVSMAAC